MQIKCLYCLMAILFSVAANAQPERYPLKNPGDWNIFLAKNPRQLTGRLDSASMMVERTVLRGDITRAKVYSLSGPIISLMDYATDPVTNKRVLHGRAIRYKTNGVADTSGYYKYGVKDGEWLAYNDDAKVIRKIIYKDGIIVSSEKVKVLSNKQKEAKRKKECPTCTGAEYIDGGSGGWKGYIARNGQPTSRYMMLPETRNRQEATLHVNFLIDTTGKIIEAYILKSVEWSVDKKMTDAILQAGNWKPATKEGQPVKSYHTQPVTIRIVEKK